MPAINNGRNHFDVLTYTGTGAAQTISGLNFQPDFVWIKNRSGTQNNYLQDSVRGATNYLVSNNTGAENQYSGYGSSAITGFNSSGFALSSDAIGMANTNAATYVAWCWKAGGTAVTNTSGTITSQVSANPTAGFSVVTYTGTGANATVGHGLGVAPSFIIGKRRNSTGNWQVYASAISNMQTGYIVLNLTDAFRTTSSAVWGNTQPTSSVFTIGTDTDLNTNGSTNVAYCFAAIAGYSAFGSYTGNGSADGPFVYCGFRPRFVLVKGTAVSSWYLWDSSRASYNVINETLYPNLSNAEGGSGGIIDFLSNGFKIRTTGTDLNANVNTMIYAAFAENPFQNSLAR